MAYADGVKKMKHLIVLTMIDNAPRYTIQLKVDNGVMTVNQIADISNRRLSPVTSMTMYKTLLKQR